MTGKAPHMSYSARRNSTQRHPWTHFLLYLQWTNSTASLAVRCSYIPSVRLRKSASCDHHPAALQR